MLTAHSSPLGAPGHLVDLDVPRDVAGSGQEAGVVPAARFELPGDGRDVDELPDLHLRPQRQPVAVQGHAHRGGEGPEMGVQVVALLANHHQLARLVGRHQQRRAELPQQRGEVRRVDRPKRRRIAGGGGVDRPSRPIRLNRGRHDVSLSSDGRPARPARGSTPADRAEFPPCAIVSDTSCVHGRFVRSRRPSGSPPRAGPVSLYCGPSAIGDRIFT